MHALQSSILWKCTVHSTRLLSNEYRAQSTDIDMLLLLSVDVSPTLLAQSIIKPMFHSRAEVPPSSDPQL